MVIKEIINKEEWNNWLLSRQPATFLQSWEWGQLHHITGEQARYLGFFENDRQVGAALVIVVTARRGNFFLCPHGPIMIENNLLALALSQLKIFCRQWAKTSPAVALRIAPLVINKTSNEDIFKNEGFRPAPLHIHAELTWVLDTSLPEEKLLNGMRKTTRHAIRKAAKEGVVVDISNDTATLERFWPLYEQTKDRHQFVPFSKEFLLQQVNEFGKSSNMFFAIAKYKGKDVAGAILIKFGKTIFYHHGASIKLPASVPAAQLLHWEAIKHAKGLGATTYNFWGIAPDNKPKHPFAGITIFKKGFGGNAVDYLHAQDYPLSMGYWLLWLVDTWRRLSRGF